MIYTIVHTMIYTMQLYYGRLYHATESFTVFHSFTVLHSGTDSCPPQLHCPLQDSFTVFHRQLVQPVTASAVKPKQLCCIFHFNAVRWTLISYESSTSGNPGYTGKNLVQQREYRHEYIQPATCQSQWYRSCVFILYIMIYHGI